MCRFLPIPLFLAIGLLFSAWNVHGLPPADVSCNFVTGVETGITAGTTCVSPLPACDGVTDDAASFDAFTSWAINTWQVAHTGLIELVLPPGRTCVNNAGGGGTITFNGIRRFRGMGYSSTLAGTYTHLAGYGQIQGPNNSTRINTVTAGSFSVTVNPTSPSQPAACATIATCTALFTTDCTSTTKPCYAMIAGFDQQSGNGYPSNPAFYQYLKIASINSTTGVITFTTPIRDTYKSTWPNYNSGSFLVPDDGGPATLYAFDPGWNTEVEWRGVRFTSPVQIDAPGRQVIFRDVTFTGNGNVCVFPTMTLYFEITNASMTNCSMEVDKMNESVSFSNIVISQIAFQSSNKTVSISGSTIANLLGTAQFMTLNNSTITGQLNVGPTLYGFTNSLTGANNSIAYIGNMSNSHAAKSTVWYGNSNEGVNNIAGFSMAAGRMTIPNAYLIASATSVGWAKPGTNICWADATYTCAQLFQITDLTQDATNTYIQTSQSGGLPTDWGFAGGVLRLQVHSALQVSLTGTTGDPQAVMLNDAAAQGRPLYSYLNLPYANATSGNGGTGTFDWPMWGYIGTMAVTVNTAYAGAPAATIAPNTLFLNYFNSALALVSFTPATINLKSGAGQTRTMNAAGVWSNSQTGDVLNNRSQALWANTSYRSPSTDLSGDPGNPMSVNVKVTTEQSVVIPP